MGLLVVIMFIVILDGCSVMPTTHSGSFAEQRNWGALSESPSVEVLWQLEAENALAVEEKIQLATYLERALSERLAINDFQVDTSRVKVRATITRVETVSPLLNIFSTALLFVPLDAGGAAVEFEAVDVQKQTVLISLSVAQWTPMSELSAQFSRLAPAEIALSSAADQFVMQFGESLMKRRLK